MTPEPEPKPTKPVALPRHPRIAHVALGSFVAAGLFDLLSALPGQALPHRELYRSAAFSLILASAALVVAAGTGFLERARRTAPGSQARNLASAHAATMAGLAATAVADIVLHLSAYSAASRAPWPVLLTTVPLLGFAVAGGHLGGRLVYQLGVGTSAGARATAPRGVRG
jgi:uncharacterized membrane protein